MVEMEERYEKRKINEDKSEEVSKKIDKDKGLNKNSKEVYRQ
jgi:hypothetical protein